jgi:hypothetical protein
VPFSFYFGIILAKLETSLPGAEGGVDNYMVTNPPSKSDRVAN